MYNMPYLLDDLGFVDLDYASSDSNDSYLPSDESRSVTPSSPNSQNVAHPPHLFTREGSDTRCDDSDLDEDRQRPEYSHDSDGRSDTDSEDQSVVSSIEVDGASRTLSPQLQGTCDFHHSSAASRREFSKRLHELEPEADLQLLYPPSLWRHDLDTGLEAEEPDLDQLFPLPALDETWTELELDEFCVYHDLNHQRYPGQYESLHSVVSEPGRRSCLLDGIVRYEGRDLSVKRMEIIRVSIGGLDLDFNSCEGQYWAQTVQSAKVEGWYRLRTPAAAYASFWTDFTWIANFAKHCVDYLLLTEQNKQLVTLKDFQSDFATSLIQKHQNDEPNTFQEWLRMSGNPPDLRRQLTQFGTFVYDVCFTTPELSLSLEEHPVWEEIGRFVSSTRVSDEQTIVTQKTASTFLTSFPQWGPDRLNLLRQYECEVDVESQREDRMRMLRLPDKFSVTHSQDFCTENGERTSKVQRTLQRASNRNISVSCPPEHLINKLVVVRQLENKQTYFDFAYVIHLSRNRRCARVVWMTVPSSTICARPKPINDHHKRKNAHYPIGNELFFSNDCNCCAVNITDIVDVHDIQVLEEVGSTLCDFFATTLYSEHDESFVRVTKEQLLFMCKTTCDRPYALKDRKSKNTTPRRSRSAARWEESTYQGQLHNEPLTNLSLFTGCGLFDRALESAGQLRTTMSIDCNAYAMCSAEANCSVDAHCDDSEFIIGSVNTELQKTMEGHRKYPRPGCLSAGCPCPGFSAANYYRHELRGQLDCTLLASTMSWVEVTLPAYIVIENVPFMDSGSPSACSQAISFLVALGYQVRKALLKATDFGGSTTRTRLFILAAAPTVKLPERPMPTHGSSGPLKPFVTIADAISNLGLVHNDTLVNIESPYHIPITRLSPNITTSGVNFRDILHRIPTSPPGQGLVDSLHLMNLVQKNWIEELHDAKRARGSKSARRVEAQGFFRTIVTFANWQCANGGQLIHYDQDRLLSLEEVARAQGVPQDFVLVGSAAQKLKQIGNAVPWCLREAIGREIVKAYSQSTSLETDMQNQVMPNVEAPGESDDDEILLSTKEDFEKVLQDRAIAHQGSFANKPKISMTAVKVITPDPSLWQPERISIDLDMKLSGFSEHDKRSRYDTTEKEDSDDIVQPPHKRRARSQASSMALKHGERVGDSSDEDDEECDYLPARLASDELLEAWT